MADCEALRVRIRGTSRSVLTGVPVSVPEADDNKRAWAQQLGDHVEVRCFLSREECLCFSRRGADPIDEPSLPRIGDAEKDALWPDSVT